MNPLIGLVLLSSPALPDAGIEPMVALEDKPPVMHRWTGAVSLGATLSDGNSENRTASATADGVYRREGDRTTLKFLWSYADNADGVTDRRLYGSGKYDHFLEGEKTYVYGQGSLEYNSTAALDLRAIIGAGLGYQVFETDRAKLAGEVGLSYVDENYEGSASDEEYLAARLAYNGEWKPTERWTLGQTGEIFPSLEDEDDVHAKVDSRAKLNLSESMFAQLQHLFTWDNTPAAGAERDDHLVLLTVGWTF